MLNINKGKEKSRIIGYVNKIRDCYILSFPGFFFKGSKENLFKFRDFFFTTKSK